MHSWGLRCQFHFHRLFFILTEYHPFCFYFLNLFLGVHMCTHGECILRCANMCTCHHAAARERRDVSGSTTFHLALLRQSLSLTQELARRPASHRRPPVSAPTVLGYRRFFFLCGCWIFKPCSSNLWSKHSTPEPSLQSCIPCSYGPLSVLQETRHRQIPPGSWDCDHAHCCLFWERSSCDEVLKWY